MGSTVCSFRGTNSTVQLVGVRESLVIKGVVIPIHVSQHSSWQRFSPASIHSFICSHACTSIMHDGQAVLNC
jgi:hypothetical protein